jgi:hypothetical protein
MNPDYSNHTYGPIKYSLSRKRQIINETLEQLHVMHAEMIEDAVQMKEYAGFPEANEIINHIRTL